MYSQAEEMGSESEPMLVMDVDTKTLHEPLKIATSTCRFRFLDCNHLVQHSRLRLYAYTKLPRGQYATISYVWRGFQAVDKPGPSFTFATSRTPTPEHPTPKYYVDVLQSACKLALQKGAPFLWVDGLCILQTSEEDKAWQIPNMYEIYNECHHCIVLPGGAERLVALEETNAWLTRAWTLQEAIAPKKTYILLRWPHAPGTIIGTGWGEIFELEGGHSAYIALGQFLGCALAEGLQFRPTKTAGDTSKSEEAVLKIGFKKFFNSSSLVATLVVAMQSEDRNEIENALWQSSFIRETGYPEDAIFSVMGMFHVTLNPLEFRDPDPNKRLAATIRMAQKIMARGGRANWLSMVFLAPGGLLDVRMCTMPKITESKEDKEWANISMPDTFLANAPVGTVDDQGYLTISTKARLIVPDEVIEGCGTVRSEKWMNRKDVVERISSTNETEPPKVNKPANEYGECWAAYIGEFRQFRSNKARWLYLNPVEVLVLRQHRSGRWHIKYQFGMPSKDALQSWEEREFAIGGPFPVENLFKG